MYLQRVAWIVGLLSFSAFQGCVVVAVADAAATVAATAVKTGATVVGAAVDVTAAGVRAATHRDDDQEAQPPSKPPQP